MLDPVEFASPRFRGAPAPSLEEEGDAVLLTLIANIPNPLEAHRAGVGTAFPADGYPGNPREVDITDRTAEGLDGKEANGGGHLFEMASPDSGCVIFDRYSTPDVPGSFAVFVSSPQIVPHEGVALRQHLINMPIDCFHLVEDPIDKRTWQLLVE